MPLFPDEMEGSAFRRRHRVEDERRNDAELASARAAQCPEEIAVVLLVAVEDSWVGKHDTRREKTIGRQPVPAAEQS